MSNRRVTAADGSLTGACLGIAAYARAPEVGLHPNDEGISPVMSN